MTRPPMARCYAAAEQLLGAGTLSHGWWGHFHVERRPSVFFVWRITNGI